MEFEATAEEVAEIAANAYNASIPTGMGFLHFKAENIDPNIFLENAKEGRISLDYVQGRMVKLYIWSDDSRLWFVRDDAPHIEYQSWVAEYPTYKALIESVLGKI